MPVKTFQRRGNLRLSKFESDPPVQLNNAANQAFSSTLDAMHAINLQQACHSGVCRLMDIIADTLSQNIYYNVTTAESRMTLQKLMDSLSLALQFLKDNVTITTGSSSYVWTISHCR